MRKRLSTKTVGSFALFHRCTVALRTAIQVIPTPRSSEFFTDTYFRERENVVTRH